MPYKDLFEHVKYILDHTGIQNEGIPGIPEAIRVFLGKLSLLQGLPFYYLVPDERYIPKTETTMEIEGEEESVEKGSLRMFTLDKDWIECLLDGAISVGSDADREYLLAKAMAGNYAAEVFYKDTKEKIKNQIYGLYSPDDHAAKLNEMLKAKNIRFLDSGQAKDDDDWLLDNGQPAPTNAQNNWRYSGFFMRSALIASWIGVEVLAIGKDSSSDSEEERPLQVVRFERVAPDTIFCICEGIITNVQITQPMESVHFGIVESEISDCMRSGVNGLIDIQSLKDKLSVITSAQFAEEMLSKPLVVNIKIKWDFKNSSLPSFSYT